MVIALGCLFGHCAWAGALVRAANTGLNMPPQPAVQASGGQYIFTPTFDQGQATFTVNIPTPGDYYMWWRVLAPSSGSNSFYLNLYSTTVNTNWTSVCDIPPQAGWRWARANRRSTGGQEATNSTEARVLKLVAGRLDFVIGGREAGTWLQRILITNDPNFVPDGATPPGNFVYAYVEAEVGTRLSPMTIDSDAPTAYQTVVEFPNLSWSYPIDIRSAPGETNRLFIVEETGPIIVLTNLATPTRTVFLDLSSVVADGGLAHGGLLSLEFHPGYTSNRFFYVVYQLNTTTPMGTGVHNRVSRFETSALDPNQALVSSEQPLITMLDEETEHNFDDLRFGPDG
jgi:hypothetical protein